MDRITPVMRPRGRAATKAHHRKPSQTVAKRAFASTAGRGKALLEYAAEMIREKRIIREDDLQRLVDSGDFGRWLDARATKVIESRQIVASLANPARSIEAIISSNKDEHSAKVAAVSVEYRKVIEETNAAREKSSLILDGEEALSYVLLNRCPNKYGDILRGITASRHIREALKASKPKRIT